MKVARQYTLNVARLRQTVGAMIEADKNQAYENIRIDESMFREKVVSQDKLPQYASSVPDEAAFTVEILEEEDPNEILYLYFFADIGDGPSQNDEMISRIFKDNEQLVFDMFLGFLQKLCQKIQTVLLYDFCSPEDVVRVHFRYLADRNSFIYKKLCTSFPEEVDSAEYELSDIKYGELIEAAYIMKTPLIHSANQAFCKQKLKDKWENFITIVPLFERNEFVRKLSEVRQKKVPYITFGVTINSNKLDKILYCMDYFSFDTMLQEVMDAYLKIFKIDVDRFCVWVKEQFKKEGGTLNG